jgi:hypothetical protein
VRSIIRAGVPLALVALLAATTACSSTATTNGADGSATGEALTATVPPHDGSSTTTEDTATTDLGSTDTAGVLPAACDLLTEADASAAFGEPAVAGDQRTDECWWSTANDLKTVNLIRRTDDVETWRSGYRNSTWRPNNLGDEGYTSTMLDSVVWRVGDVHYEVNVVYSTSGDARQAALDLATQAASRL